jgi:hypothetical protein
MARLLVQGCQTPPNHTNIAHQNDKFIFRIIFNKKRLTKQETPRHNFEHDFFIFQYKSRQSDE